MTPKQERFAQEYAEVAAGGLFYVYVLTDPRTGEPFYVGKGKGKRVMQHEAAARARRFDNPVRTRTILDIWAAGLSVVYEFAATGLGESEAFRLERRLIGERGLARLANIAPGTLDEVTRSRMVAADLLSRTKPFDVWVAERPRSERDVELYHFVRNGLEQVVADGWDSTVVVTCPA